jgi:hypothetical protein
MTHEDYVQREKQPSFGSVFCVFSAVSEFKKELYTVS